MSDKPASPARGRKKTAPPAQQPPQEEVVVRLPLTDLHPFPDHPFQVRDDEEMKETIQSVKEYGVIVPAIVRPREEGGYEIVAGHRRKYACEQAGLDTMPVLIRNLDRDAATIIMVDSNLQRENILPSERAKAYKMKLEAIKRQGARNDLTSPKISAKLRSDDEIGQQRRYGPQLYFPDEPGPGADADGRREKDCPFTRLSDCGSQAGGTADTRYHDRL